MVRGWDWTGDASIYGSDISIHIGCFTGTDFDIKEIIDSVDHKLFSQKSSEKTAVTLSCIYNTV